MSLLVDYSVSRAVSDSVLFFSSSHTQNIRLLNPIQELCKDTSVEFIFVNARLKIANDDRFYLPFHVRTELAEKSCSKEKEKNLPYIVLYSPSAQEVSVNSTTVDEGRL